MTRVLVGTPVGRRRVREAARRLRRLARRPGVEAARVALLEERLAALERQVIEQRERTFSLVFVVAGAVVVAIATQWLG